jgi:hypothetical protein
MRRVRMSTNRADHLYDAIWDELDTHMGERIPESLLKVIDELYYLADIEAERIRTTEKYGVDQ